VWVAITATIASTVVALAAIAATFFAPARVAKKIEQRREKRDLRRAIRLVRHEIRENVGAMARLIPGPEKVAYAEALAPIEPFVTDSNWVSESGVLATSLSLDAWNKVESAYRSFTVAALEYKAIHQLHRFDIEGDEEKAALLKEYRGRIVESFGAASVRFDEADAALAAVRKPLTD
jgi:hypothetical protein